METSAASPSAPAAVPLRPLPVVGGDLALDFANTVDDPWGPGCFDHVGDLPRLLGDPLPDGFWLPDGVHPSHQGQTVLLRHVVHALVRLPPAR